MSRRTGCHFHTLVLAVLTVAVPAAAAAQVARGFDVEHYDAEVRPDIARQSLTGSVTITVRATADPTRRRC